jgi:hypothetical protein
VADATSGWVVRDTESLTAAIAGLGDRIRLTYQTAGAADGSLLRVEVRQVGGEHVVRFPRWTRSGVPANVAAARVRSVLAGDLVEGELDAHARLLPAGGEDGRRLLAGLDAYPDPEPGAPSGYRLTIGAGLPDRAPVVRHEVVSWPPVGGDHEGWVVAAPPEAAPGAETWIAVLIEELATGRWGCDLLTLPAGRPSAARRSGG